MCWFSCGAASAVATKLAITENAGLLPLVVAYTEVAEEHPDNKRFLADCERWFGVPVTVLKNEKYGGSTDAVFLRERFLVGPHGAACTRLLKRQVRMHFEEEGDRQVFGYTAEEQERSDDFFERNSHIDGWVPLIDRSLMKADCLAMISDAGIDIPVMYKLGYKNNNCIGCVKGGMGYWNKIRVDFPDRFQQMVEIESEIGHAVINTDEGIVFLKDLDPGRGRMQDEPDIECSIFCHLAKSEYSS